MPNPFKKYLCLSSETSRDQAESFVLDRVSWTDLSILQNLADYDAIVFNLTASFWEQFFNCAGQFDATAFWSKLPAQFQMPTPAAQGQPDTPPTAQRG